MISPLAQVYPNAVIGTDVTIEAFSVIHDDVEIGEGTHIMSNVVIFSGTRIGKNCKIYPGAVLGAVPQDLKFEGEQTTVVIGDNTSIRECVTINRGTSHTKTTTVGNNCLLMAYVHVAHDCKVGNNVILANAVQLAGHVILDDYVTIGGLTGVQQFIHVGAHTYISGHILIRKDIPPYIKAARDPQVYAGMNSVGLRRRNFSKELIDEISAIYHILFVQGYNTTKALEILNERPPSAVRDEIVQFVKTSRSGIIKRPSKTSSNEDNAN